MKTMLVLLALALLVGALLRVAELVAFVVALKAALAAAERLRRDRRSMAQHAAARAALTSLAAPERPTVYTGVLNPGSPSWYDNRGGVN